MKQLLNQIGLKNAVSQPEILERGQNNLIKKARIWTLVDFDKVGQQTFEVAPPAPAPATDKACTQSDADTVGGVKVATITNGTFWAKIPVGTVVFEKPVSAFTIPGPVVSVSQDGKSWVGSGYLDSILRVKSVTSEIESGPVFWQSKITYRFEENKTYTARVRIYPGKNYAQLVEDFDLGGNSKFIFNYDDWQPPFYISCTDQAQTKVFNAPTAEAGDFVKEEGQRCLVRLVVWTQFGYFGGKSETIGLVDDNGARSVGGFYIRPDRWTRAKVNHVDLYDRPEVPGDRMTRGVTGLADSKRRYAMEAWLVEGHREWALYAMPIGTVRAAAPEDKDQNPKTDWSKFRKAHVVEGVWPLDRINRMTLVWNPDGTPTTHEETAPAKGTGMVGNILMGMQGRAGLQEFNGSNGQMRGDKTGLLKWATSAGPFKKAADIATADAKAGIADRMTGPAMWAYMAMDESTYPGKRAMLPWTDPEALNPFYQGMENMNFNADRYRCVSQMGAGLAALGHPDGPAIRDHGVEQMSMALDRYVYPDSGCWEESHSYALHTIHNLVPLANTLNSVGARNFYEDERFAKLFAFFADVLSPPDPDFGGTRVVPPVGDHGLGFGLAERLKPGMTEFAKSQNPKIKELVGKMAWAVAETGSKTDPLPPGVVAVAPKLESKYLQGYGVTLRGKDASNRESFVLLRAEQSWGHHHQDKGSLWGWFRNVHFFGDAAWGGPPGGTYGNSYKQGPASGTQIEFRGVNNWTLPCKYPAPWISDDEYKPGLFDYANSRCMYPFNPKIDLNQSTPVVSRNGYDRQVLFVHPDLLVVRDNIETTCETIWRMHTYQPDNLKIADNTVTMNSAKGVTGLLNFVYPQKVAFSVLDAKDELDKDTAGVGTPFGSKPGPENDKDKNKPRVDTRSSVLRWDMPKNVSATWTFSASNDGEALPQSKRLDDAGRVTEIKLADGRTIIVLMAIEPFTYNANGIDFEGTVGLVIKNKDGKITAHNVRGKRLEAK